MSFNRYARRQDGNHTEIRRALEQIGVGVIDTSSSGAGLPDLLCCQRGVIVLVEIKNPKGRGKKLTIAQVQLHDMLRTHGYTVHVVTNVAEALAVFGAR